MLERFAWWNPQLLRAKSGPTVFVLDQEDREAAEGILRSGHLEPLRELPPPADGAAEEPTPTVDVGDEFTGKVVQTTTFGAFVELAKGTDGLLHISDVAPGQEVASVEEVLRQGDEVEVRVVEVDRERGRIRVQRAEQANPALDDPGESSEQASRQAPGARRKSNS